MTWDEFIDPTYREESGRRPFPELIAELAERTGRPLLSCRPTHSQDNTRKPRLGRELLRVYGPGL